MDCKLFCCIILKLSSLERNIYLVAYTQSAPVKDKIGVGPKKKSLSFYLFNFCIEFCLESQPPSWPFTTFLMLLKFTKIAFIYTRMIVNYHTRYKMNKFGLFKIIPLLLMTWYIATLRHPSAATIVRKKNYGGLSKQQWAVSPRKSPLWKLHSAF